MTKNPYPGFPPFLWGGGGGGHQGSCSPKFGPIVLVRLKVSGTFWIVKIHFLSNSILL